MMRDKSMSIVIDKKSPDPKSRQISKLIKQFTAGSIPHYKELVSTDQFKDMIEIERQFGRLDWDLPTQENTKGDPTKLNPYWSQLYSKLQSGPKNWREFLKFID
jgi:hypothetical protein